MPKSLLPLALLDLWAWGDVLACSVSLVARICARLADEMAGVALFARIVVVAVSRPMRGFYAFAKYALARKRSAPTRAYPPPRSSEASLAYFCRSPLLIPHNRAHQPPSYLAEAYLPHLCTFWTFR